MQCPEEPPESLAVAPWLNLLEPDDFCVRPPEDNTLLASPPPDPKDRRICRELKIDEQVYHFYRLTKITQSVNLSVKSCINIENIKV